MTIGSAHDHPHLAPSLGEDVQRQQERLLALRSQLLEEQAHAASPAVARALGTVDDYLFLALGYLGHTGELFPDERSSPSSR